jgi:hypothetical protein
LALEHEMPGCRCVDPVLELVEFVGIVQRPGGAGQGLEEVVPCLGRVVPGFDQSHDPAAGI